MDCRPQLTLRTSWKRDVKIGEERIASRRIIGSKTVANLGSVIHILPSLPELQTKFAALSYEFKLMIHRTYSFVSRWKLIKLQSCFLSIRCSSDPSNLIKEWRNILWNAWWWKHMEMNSRRNTPFTVKYVSATMISKNISRAYPITACWFHGRLWNFEERSSKLYSSSRHRAYSGLYRVLSESLSEISDLKPCGSKPVLQVKSSSRKVQIPDLSLVAFDP